MPITEGYTLKDAEKKEFSETKAEVVTHNKDALLAEKATYQAEIARIDALLVEAGKLGL
jgi:hypothetical protein